jgi:hypothetical protein
MYPFLLWYLSILNQMSSLQVPSLQMLSLQTRFLSVCLPYRLICGVLLVGLPISDSYENDFKYNNDDFRIDQVGNTIGNTTGTIINQQQQL